MSHQPLDGAAVQRSGDHGGGDGAVQRSSAQGAVERSADHGNGVAQRSSAHSAVQRSSVHGGDGGDGDGDGDGDGVVQRSGILNRAAAQRLAIIGGGVAMLLVGTSTAVAATIADYPVLIGQSIRFALAAVILLAVVRAQRLPRVRLTVRDVLLLVALAATGLAGFNLFLIEATRHASPAMIGSVVGAVPVALALLAPVLQRRKPSRRTVIAAMVVAGGTAVAAGLGSGSVAGLLLAIGALGCEVLFSLLAIPLLPKLGPTRVSAYAATLAVPMLLVAGLGLEGADALRMPTLAEGAAYVYLGVLVTAVAFLLWYNALRRIGADRSGLLAGLVPVGALLTTAVLGIAPVTVADIAGAVIVGAGIAFGLRKSGGRRDADRPGPAPGGGAGGGRRGGGRGPAPPPPHPTQTPRRGRARWVSPPPPFRRSCKVARNLRILRES
ncbi:DMT family transporter [Glycomyces algeriensis]|uniref:DMT family transporter n=1 Tax=Glycomyces algeriensis TaxID=256037 RepID=UPI0022D6E908|nr:DMT family transporter [Glycomyces algeriensis]MDA1366819.1 DMT family transporter [Glycomyces algeriensis]